MEIAILALGCFWSPEEKFSKLNGIINTEVGYCGGKMKQTSYEEVCGGSTGHAEVVKIETIAIKPAAHLLKCKKPLFVL